MKPLFVLIVTLSVASVFGQKPLPVVFLSPLPGETWLSPDQQIVVRLSEHEWVREEAVRVHLVGLGGVVYEARIALLPASRTISVSPVQSFRPGDEVTATVMTGSYDPYIFSFRIRESIPKAMKPISSAEVTYKSAKSEAPAETGNTEARVINGVGIPADFPLIEVLQEGETAPGYLFLGNWGNSHYMMMLKNDGTPYYYRRSAEHIRDFKVQRNGYVTRREYGNIQGNVMMDSSFHDIDTINCIGYGTDEHECIISPEGNILLIALDYKTVDMSKIVTNGKPNATIVGNHIQELDKNHHVLFEWRCWDQFSILGAEHEDLTAGWIDYIHMNSVDYDYDGHIICSSRHLSECTKINRNTGEIMWRLGGKFNQFNFVNDPDRFSYQHDFRAVPGKPNHYTVFDNGNFHSPHYSRAVEYVIDTENMTATKVWEYRHQPNDYATWWMGNAQRLPNGNTLINWADGSLPKTTEVNPAGEVVYEMDFVNYYHCYRTFRYEWLGKAEAPYLLSETGKNGIQLIFNKFGDEGVAEYRIYSGKENPPDSFLKSSKEPVAMIYEADNHSTTYFRVRAVDSTGMEGPWSNTVSAGTAWLEPGANQVVNGDFKEQTTGWKLLVHSGNAVGLVNGAGEYQVDIADPSDDYWKIQLVQEPVALEQYKTYRLEFDARAQFFRVIEPRIEQRGGAWANYCQVGPITLNTKMQHFSFTFVMYGASDSKAGIVFNCGKDMGDVYIDNVVLTNLSAPCTYSVEASLVEQEGEGNDDLALSISGAVMPVVYYLDNAFALVTESEMDTVYQIKRQNQELGVIDASGCYTKTELALATRLNDRTYAEGIFVLYPNPVSGQLNLRFKYDVGLGVQVSIANVAGSKVYDKIIHRAEGFEVVQIELDFLTPGTYLLTATDIEKQETQTISFQYINK